MVKTIHLPSLNSIVQTGRAFYDRCGARPLYEHGRLVIEKEASAGIVEGKVIVDTKADFDRRKANYIIAQTTMYHTLKSGHIEIVGEKIPDALRDEAVLEEIDKFSGLTENERSGAPLKDYASLLNNGHAPLALLVKLADYAVTHKMEDQIEGLVGNHRSSLFRLYSSTDEAQRLLRMDALAGEKIYGPVAELFGYPRLAGDIFEHSFRVNHPDIYERVKSVMTDQMMLQRLSSTQALVTDVARLMRNILTAYGFQTEIEIRRQKHDGKKMNKVLRIMKKDHEDLQAPDKGTSEAYVRDNVSKFDFERFNDWVALRVIIRKFRGIDIDHMIGNAVPAIEGDAKSVSYDFGTMDKLLQKVRVGELRLALKVVGDVIRSLELTSPALGKSKCNITYFEKDNGYRAFHFDTVSDSGLPMRVLPFEIQLKTAEWYDIAEHGKAAHYYYLGGDTEFVDMIKAAYHDIIHRNDNGKKANAHPPGFCGV
jgi:hypothetical protein